MKVVKTVVGLIVITLLLSLLWVLIGPPMEVECKTDQDCIPTNPMPGIEYFCDKGVCKTKFPDELSCQKNEDCVPAACCHPDSCVNKNYQPDCKGIVCTLECRPGTMDCGQGHCVCIDNICQVEWT